MNESIVSIIKYNGWTNRETWVVNLWLNSDEATYLEVQDLLTRALAGVDWHEIARATIE